MDAILSTDLNVLFSATTAGLVKYNICFILKIEVYFIVLITYINNI